MKQRDVSEVSPVRDAKMARTRLCIWCWCRQSMHTKFGSSLLSQGLYPGRAQLVFVRGAATRCAVVVDGAALYAILAW